MIYEFEAYQMDVDDHLFWVAKSKTLNGCLGQGDTFDEAISELEANEFEWLETAKEFKIPIPNQTAHREPSFSGKCSLRFSPLMHSQAAENAKRMGISLNQYITDAISYYNGMVHELYAKPILDTSVTETTTNIININEYNTQKRSFNINLTDDLEEL